MGHGLSEEKNYDFLVDLLERGDYSQCIDGCLGHIETFGDSAKIWVLMGSAFGASDRPEQARKALLCALKIDPDHENAQVNYVTSCLHGGYKHDAIESIKEFVPAMSDECLAFKMAPCLAEALEQGMLESTDLNPQIWQRIEEILRDMDSDFTEEDFTDINPKDNIIQFPLQGPRPLHTIDKPYPIAHWVFEGANYQSATLFVEKNCFHLRAYYSFIASPLDFEDPRGDRFVISDPQQLAQFLFAGMKPQSIGFLKLCRQDWDSGDDAFFYFDCMNWQAEGLQGLWLVKSSLFEEKNYHFKKDAQRVDFQQGLKTFTENDRWSGLRRLSDLWSPPYLGEIVLMELIIQIEKMENSRKKAS